MRLIVRSTCVIALASFATLLVSTGAVRAESLAIVNARAYTGEQAEPIEQCDYRDRRRSHRLGDG